MTFDDGHLTIGAHGLTVNSSSRAAILTNDMLTLKAEEGVDVSTSSGHVQLSATNGAIQGDATTVQFSASRGGASISASQGDVTVSASQGNVELVATTGSISLATGSDLSLRAQAGTVNISAPQSDISVRAAGTVEISGRAVTRVSGGNLELVATEFGDGQMTLRADDILLRGAVDITMEDGVTTTSLNRIPAAVDAVSLK